MDVIATRVGKQAVNLELPNFGFIFKVKLEEDGLKINLDSFRRFIFS
jgi:hypothetical protein